MREYVWLTSPQDLEDQIPAFFALNDSKARLSYAMPLRHGERLFRGSGVYPLSFSWQHYEAERKYGCFRYYLAGVGPEGLSLDLANIVFLLNCVGPAFVVGSDVWRRLESTCNVANTFVMDIPPGRIRAHAWNYTMDGTFCEHIGKAIGTDGTWVISHHPKWLQILCKRYPCKRSFDGLKAIYPPSIASESILGVRWVRSKGYLAMVLRRNAQIIIDASDRRPIGPEYFEAGGVLQRRGLIVPKSIGDFDDLDEKFEWPRVACKFDLRIEWD